MAKKAIIFPGQGAQYSKMGLSLYENFEKARGVFERVDSISGIRVSDAIFSDDSSGLKDTSIQQLAILAVSLAAYAQLEKDFGKVDFLSGLSLGEYSCLYAGGVLSLDDVILLVKTRGQAMQKAAQLNPSSMLVVIGAQEKDLAKKEKDLGFYISNINAPAQVVISTEEKKKEKVKNNLEESGLKVVELSVSGGFHSPFMAPAREELKRIIGQLNFSDSKIPIVSNVTASPHTESCRIKDNLLEQLVSPVLWMDSVNFISEKGINCFYEVGPSKILKGLLRKIDRNLNVINIEKEEDFGKINTD